jgi:SAM-dependent methyltransferase
MPQTSSNIGQSKCPVCGDSVRDLFEKHSLMIRECLNCRHQFYVPPDVESHVTSVYGDDYFQGSSAGYTDYLGEEKAQRLSAKYYVRQIARFRQPGRSLDVGAACGFFVKEFLDAGWQASGLEPNGTMRMTARQRYGLELFEGQIKELPQGEAYDLVTMIQVVSHLIDPVDSIKEIRSRLSAKGLFLVETWDRRSLAAMASGRGWHEYNPPSVLHWFSRRSLREVVESQGFRLLATGLPRKRIQLGRAARMIRHSVEQSTLGRWLTWPLSLAPAKLAAPYFLGDAFWMLFQKK